MAMAFQHMSQYFAALKPGSLVLEAGLFVSYLQMLKSSWDIFEGVSENNGTKTDGL